MIKKPCRLKSTYIKYGLPMTIFILVIKKSGVKKMKK